jgi:DNA-nicking Smr family endonuclease
MTAVKGINDDCRWIVKMDNHVDRCHPLKSDRSWHMQPVVVPINGILDLHTFASGDVGRLIGDYIDASLESGIYDLRIIHGKGKGVMRARVRALLEQDSRVESIGDAPIEAGGWGATLVKLKRTYHDRQRNDFGCRQ